jgi:circadian clock protein KaiC
MPAATTVESLRLSTGIAGLDQILGGGLPRHRLHLLQGDPGTGKTTLALQFLLEGARRGESALYVSLSETEEEIREVAQSHGWSLDGLALHELASLPASLRGDDENTLFHASEVELRETMALLLAEVDRVRPARVVFDSLSELRLMAQSPLRYRRQILALKQFFAGRKCTVLLLDDRTSEPDDLQLQSLAHGVVLLEQSAPSFGPARRLLRVQKMRGVRFVDGYHDIQITTGGIVVHPRLVAREHDRRPVGPQLRSGLPALDALLGGGLDRGTSTLLIGPAGVGKSAIAAKFAQAATVAGEHAILFTFEESTETLFTRSAGLGMDLRPQVEAGRLLVRGFDPAEVSPGEFTYAVVAAVEERDAAVVVIDSLNGYLHAMPDERFLALHMHELLAYLARRGVATLLLTAQHGLIGPTMRSPVDVSYLADNVLLFRFFEAQGRVRRAISVTKRRRGPHEDTIRELSMHHGGIAVGDALTEFQGVLTGVPRYSGSPGRLRTARTTDGHRTERTDREEVDAADD